MSMFRGLFLLEAAFFRVRKPLLRAAQGLLVSEER